MGNALHTVLVHKEIVYLCHIALSNLGAKLLIFHEKAPDKTEKVSAGVKL